MALLDCLKKIKIEDDIADFMLDRSSELAEGTMSQLEADRQVIQEMLQDIENTLDQIATQLRIKRDTPSSTIAEEQQLKLDLPMSELDKLDKEGEEANKYCNPQGN